MAGSNEAKQQLLEDQKKGNSEPAFALLLFEVCQANTGAPGCNGIAGLYRGAVAHEGAGLTALGPEKGACHAFLQKRGSGSLSVSPTRNDRRKKEKQVKHNPQSLTPILADYGVGDERRDTLGSKIWSKQKGRFALGK